MMQVSDNTWRLYTQEICTMDTCLFHTGLAPQKGLYTLNGSVRCGEKAQRKGLPAAFLSDFVQRFSPTSR
jgi:hypothetical protein